MKPEILVNKLQKALGSNIESVILYGSSASGDHFGKHSDYNVLIVAKKLDVAELTSLTSLSVAWRRAGNPSPLFFTLERLKKSADVFPIELLDIKDSHRLLFGRNILDEIQIHPENLRLILEHELKSSLIRLRENFLLTGGKPKKINRLMIDSLSTFLVLFRASLRLFHDTVPPVKLEALEKLSKKVSFDTEVFKSVDALKRGQKLPKGTTPLALFELYLKTIESVIDAVDSQIHPSSSIKG